MGGNIKLVREDCGIARLVLSRSVKKNALTKEMIRDMMLNVEALQWEPPAKLRFLVLEGEGDFFCSGADLGEMETAGNLPREDNVEDALVLARLFREFASLPFPTMAKVRGGALALGAGLLAAADFVAAEETAIFGTPEVRTGLIPAVVGLYLNRKIGLSGLSSMSLSGKLFSAREALSMGLIHNISPCASLENDSERLESEFLSCGPEALRRMKMLLLKLSPLPEREIEEFAALHAAEARASIEGKEGMASRKGKKDPAWSAKRDEK